MSRDRIRAQLVIDEGLRLKPYTDTVGKVTIGCGRNLSDNGISRAEAMTLLENDIDSAERGLMLAYPWMRELDPVRYAVLCNMMFNLGPVRFEGFVNTLALVKAGRYAEAAQHMLASRWAAQVGTRAIRLARMMESGAWPL